MVEPTVLRNSLVLSIFFLFVISYTFAHPIANRTIEVVSESEAANDRQQEQKNAAPKKPATINEKGIITGNAEMERKKADKISQNGSLEKTASSRLKNGNQNTTNVVETSSGQSINLSQSIKSKLVDEHPIVQENEKIQSSQDFSPVTVSVSQSDLTKPVEENLGPAIRDDENPGIELYTGNISQPEYKETKTYERIDANSTSITVTVPFENNKLVSKFTDNLNIGVDVSQPKAPSPTSNDEDVQESKLEDEEPKNYPDEGLKDIRPKFVENESSQKTIKTNPEFPEQEDSHFFAYFIIAVVIFILGYLIIHNKQKILGLIVEGRLRKRGRRATHAYRKLDNEKTIFS